MFNDTVLLPVLPTYFVRQSTNLVGHAWARVTRTYHNDPLLHQFMHATPDQVIIMWNRYDLELDSFHSQLVVRRIANKNDVNCTRLLVYTEDLEGL
jgi:hypothetical protein